MQKLKNIQSGEIYTFGTNVPSFSAGVWCIGNMKFVDPTKTKYEIIDYPEISDLSISPIRFKLLFTATQRIAIRTSVNPVVQDFFNLIEDPRLDAVILPLSSTVDALSYLVSINILTEEEKTRILSNTLPL